MARRSEKRVSSSDFGEGDLGGKGRGVGRWRRVWRGVSGEVVVGAHDVFWWEGEEMGHCDARGASPLDEGMSFTALSSESDRKTPESRSRERGLVSLGVDGFEEDVVVRSAMIVVFGADVLELQVHFDVAR